MMTIKEMIKREAMIEATTIKVGDRKIDLDTKKLSFEGEDLSIVKGLVDDAIYEISKYIVSAAGGKKNLSYAEGEKEAKGFIKNYLKGVYGK